MCHYLHTADLEYTNHNSAEMRDWLLQSKMQLVRRYKGKLSEFAKVATVYTRAAMERADLMKNLDDGRRVGPVLETFDYAKKKERLFPRPRTPPPFEEKCEQSKRPKSSSTTPGPAFHQKQKRV
jgi:hypothetical protein